tara:strand:+ start:53 stop:181 length:129 start_codon:yes stop_codon:yes gene_type:complete
MSIKIKPMKKLDLQALFIVKRLWKVGLGELLANSVRSERKQP